MSGQRQHPKRPWGQVPKAIRWIHTQSLTDELLGKRLPLPFHNLNFLLEGVTTKTMNSVSEVFLRRTTCYIQSQFAVIFERVAYVLNIDLRTSNSKKVYIILVVTPDVLEQVSWRTVVTCTKCIPDWFPRTRTSNKERMVVTIPIP